jgi:hypothetical protein
MAALTAWAGPDPQPRPGGPNAGTTGIKSSPDPQIAHPALEKLRNMTPAQRKEALKNVPPERRKQIEQRLEKYQQLTPQERQRLRNFQQLPADKQEAIRNIAKKFNSVPVERREQLRTEFQNLQAMSADERRDRMNSDEFRSRYGQRERALLEDLSHLLPN